MFSILQLWFRKAFFRKQKQKEKMIFLRGADSEFIVGEKPQGSYPPIHNAIERNNVQWNQIQLIYIFWPMESKHCTMWVIWKLRQTPNPGIENVPKYLLR